MAHLVGTVVGTLSRIIPQSITWICVVTCTVLTASLQVVVDTADELSYVESNFWDALCFPLTILAVGKNVLIFGWLVGYEGVNICAVTTVQYLFIFEFIE